MRTKIFIEIKNLPNRIHYTWDLIKEKVNKLKNGTVEFAQR